MESQKVVPDSSILPFQDNMAATDVSDRSDKSDTEMIPAQDKVPG